MRLVTTILVALTTAACSPGNPMHSTTLIPKDKVEQVSTFTLQCIENSPNAEEEDHVYACQHVAKQLYGITHYYIADNMSRLCVSTKPEETLACWKRINNDVR